MRPYQYVLGGFRSFHVVVLTVHEAELPSTRSVSFDITFAYDLFILINILSPLTGKSNLTLSLFCVHQSNQNKIQDNEITVCFGVESLFSNVPIEGAVQAALRRRENVPGLAERTTMITRVNCRVLASLYKQTFWLTFHTMNYQVTKNN